MAEGLIGTGTGSGLAPANFNGEEEEAKPNVSEGEQEQYDMFVKNGMELLYTPDGEVLPEVLNRLGTGKPAAALAQTAVWLVMMVENSAEQNGAEIDDEVVMHAGEELFDQLIEISEKAKLHEFSEKEIEGAWYSALDLYREANTDDGSGKGRIKPDLAAADFQALNDADKEGRADDVLPGFRNVATQMDARIGQEEAPVDEEQA